MTPREAEFILKKEGYCLRHRLKLINSIVGCPICVTNAEAMDKARLEEAKRILGWIE